MLLLNITYASHRFDCGVFTMLHMQHWEGKILKPFCMVRNKHLRFLRKCFDASNIHLGIYYYYKLLPNFSFFEYLMHAENA
jgi:hypothetical protein